MADGFNQFGSRGGVFSPSVSLVCVCHRPYCSFVAACLTLFLDALARIFAGMQIDTGVCLYAPVYHRVCVFAVESNLINHSVPVMALNRNVDHKWGARINDEGLLKINHINQSIMLYVEPTNGSHFICWQ